ncbi:MAG: MiaB/RimO family radical SAM methylthiotransferase, partial [Candidatus Tectomicrobia bacterium]|nr:MiaB/RimO family radical SAM methylthiotransferase [Candidatus Tectomicrobia bacterium]
MPEKSTEKVALVSLGCPKNLVDSEIMLAKLTEVGYELTSSTEEAQVIVVNTCGFIEAAKKESIDAILQVSRLKESGACQKIVVTGCLSQRYKGELARELPEVDLFLGTNEYDRIAELVGNGNGRREVYSHHLMAYEKPLARVLATPSYTAYLKIAEGCSRPCTFCVIPQIRGRFRSRPAGVILEEARRLADQGVREINLIAQDINYYGKDARGEIGLAELLEKLNQIEGLRWIRVLYNYPLGMDDFLLDAYASLDKVCKYVD